MSEVHLARCDRCGAQAEMVNGTALPDGRGYLLTGVRRSVPWKNHLLTRPQLHLDSLCPGCWTALSEWVAAGPMERTEPEPTGGWVDTVPVPHG